MINHLAMLKNRYITSPETDFVFNAETKTITDYTGSGGNVIIPATIGGVPVEHIGVNAFRESWPVCLLTGVVFPNSVITIADSSFFGCGNLASVMFGHGLVEIDENAFHGCRSLESIIFNRELTSIGNGAFTYCPLVSVTLPASLATYGSAVFWRCDDLSEILVDGDNDYFSSENGVLFSKDKTILYESPYQAGSYSVPSGVTTIKSGAFKQQPITEIIFPASLTTIESVAFLLCSSLTSVIFPSSFTTFGSWVFYACSNLTSAHFNGNAPTMLNGFEAFLDCHASFAITYNSGATGFTTPTWNGYPCTPV